MPMQVNQTRVAYTCEVCPMQGIDAALRDALVIDDRTRAGELTYLTDLDISCGFKRSMRESLLTILGSLEVEHDSEHRRVVAVT